MQGSSAPTDDPREWRGHGSRFNRAYQGEQRKENQNDLTSGATKPRTPLTAAIPIACARLEVKGATVAAFAVANANALLSNVRSRFVSYS